MKIGDKVEFPRPRFKGVWQGEVLEIKTLRSGFVSPLVILNEWHVDGVRYRLRGNTVIWLGKKSPVKVLSTTTKGST